MHLAWIMGIRKKTDKWPAFIGCVYFIFFLSHFTRFHRVTRNVYNMRLQHNIPNGFRDFSNTSSVHYAKNNRKKKIIICFSF